MGWYVRGSSEAATYASADLTGTMREVVFARQYVRRAAHYSSSPMIGLVMYIDVLDNLSAMHPWRE